MTTVSRTIALLALALLLTACASNQKAELPPPSYDGPDPIETIDAFIVDRAIDKSDPTWKTHVPRPPAVAFDPGQQYFWVLQTNVGTVKIELLPQYAPRHVASTIYLTRLGFYDGLGFHRIIPNIWVSVSPDLKTFTN
jgi:hypothetical protein